MLGYTKKNITFYIMKNKKISARGAYLAPECEALELKFREGLLSGSDVLLWGNALDPGADLLEDGIYTYEF